MQRATAPYQWSFNTANPPRRPGTCARGVWAVRPIDLAVMAGPAAVGQQQVGFIGLGAMGYGIASRSTAATASPRQSTFTLHTQAAAGPRMARVVGAAAAGLRTPRGTLLPWRATEPT